MRVWKGPGVVVYEDFNRSEVSKDLSLSRFFKVEGCAAPCCARCGIELNANSQGLRTWSICVYCERVL